MVSRIKAARPLRSRKMSIRKPTNLLVCMGRQLPSGVRSLSSLHKALLPRHWEGTQSGGHWRRFAIPRFLRSNSTPMSRAMAFDRLPNMPLTGLRVQDRSP
jgi:hypothetical protein